MDRKYISKIAFFYSLFLILLSLVPIPDLGWPKFKLFESTANTISKISNGLADDLASTLVLASNKKIFIAPAMNVRMWEHKTNKENIKRLNEFGYGFIGPEIGDMACGEYGEGKMSEPEKIFDSLDKYFKNVEDNKRKKVLVTAGPTRENIDPVRFI